MRRVAVTGMGVISPVGNDRSSFWNNLIAGKNGIGLLTRFDTSEQKVKVAAQVEDFDPVQYMERAQVRKTDLFAQYAMAAAVQAMQDAGLCANENIQPERLGVYVGSGCGGINTITEQCSKFWESGPRHVSPFLIPMMIGNIASGNIAIRFHAQGPNLPVVTACATSTHAIGEAFRAIRYGYADAIIAGGAEAAINEVGVAGFANCKALTTCEDPESACSPFDARRSGFVMGEGAGILVLEEYEHAKARGATIYAEIAGYGNTCDAHHITAPDPEAKGAARAFELALQEAGISNLAEHQLYINAHGTSTPLNDSSETLAIKLVLGEEQARRAKISSTKSMTGHMLGAAGAVEAIASVMALYTGILPPTIHYEQPDPACDLDYLPNHSVQLQPTIALSDSLGFGGHNGCLAFTRV